jgi:hypothetical protein
MVRHGMYQMMYRMASPPYGRDYGREQASRGLLTAAISASDSIHFHEDPGTGLALMIEATMECGLTTAGEPIIVNSANGATIAAARPHASRAWPGIVLAGHENPSVHDYPSIMQEKREANDHGCRNSNTTCGTAALDRFYGEGGAELGHPCLGTASDVWVVQGKTFRADTNERAAEMGSEVWSYFCDECTDKPEVTRYYAGLWAWARGVKNCLLWAYQDDGKGRHGSPSPDAELRIGAKFTYAVPKPDGSIEATTGYDGFTKGIADCRILEAASASPDPAVQQYLDELRPKIATPMARRFVGGAPLDSDEITKDLLRMMKEAPCSSPMP